MANRYTEIDFNQPVSSYVPMPMDYIYKAGLQKQANQDKATAEALDIAGKQWNQLPSDLEYSKKAKSEIDSIINDFAGKDFSNPTVRTEWNKKKRELSNRFSATGDIGNIQANYDAYRAYEKNILDKAKDLGWSQDELRSHLGQAKKSFQGTVNEDSSFNAFEGRGVSNYVDPNEWASKALKDVAEDTGVQSLKKYSSLNEVTDAFRSGEIEHKDYNKIMNALAYRAAGDTKLKASLEQEGLFKGQTGWSNFAKGVDDKGNIIPNEQTPFGNILAGVSYGAQYQKEKEHYMKVTDPYELYKLKKKDDEADLNKQMNWSIQGIPTDPNNPTNNDSGINTVLKNTDTHIGDNWEFKNGKLELKHKVGQSKSVVNIDGKDYNLDKLPEGYSIHTTPLTRSKTGVEIPPRTTVVDSNGNVVPIKSKSVTTEDNTQAYRDIIRLAQRLGVKSKEFKDYKEAVDEYMKTANNFQMNFTKFDEGTSSALSKAFGADIAKDGTILNPGQLSFSTIKTLDGKPLEADDLDIRKAGLLNNAKIIGLAKSINNTNYKAGDMYFQTVDPETKKPRVLIINTNNKDFNNANEASTRLTQSINNYILTGKVDDSSLLNKLNNTMGAYGAHKFVSAQVDPQGNVYGSYVKSNKKDANGKPIIEFGVVKYDSNGTPIPMALDEANKELDKAYITPLLPAYNTKNFDRATKTDEFESIINAAMQENED